MLEMFMGPSLLGTITHWVFLSQRWLCWSWTWRFIISIAISVALSNFDQLVSAPHFATCKPFDACFSGLLLSCNVSLFSSMSLTEWQCLVLGDSSAELITVWWRLFCVSIVIRVVMGSITVIQLLFSSPGQ